MTELDTFEYNLYKKFEKYIQNYDTMPYKFTPDETDTVYGNPNDQEPYMIDQLPDNVLFDTNYANLQTYNVAQEYITKFKNEAKKAGLAKKAEGGLRFKNHKKKSSFNHRRSHTKKSIHKHKMRRSRK
jgi:hypothetical protein